ncbi:GAF domain-containing protein [Nocardia sp. NPDC059240]|uniref:GAF domain-containing protein n=1 Tax=Nocardia sp. NPDC059240 TaxID=3346786 RepID=UPI0036B0FE95
MDTDDDQEFEPSQVPLVPAADPQSDAPDVPKAANVPGHPAARHQLRCRQSAGSHPRNNWVVAETLADPEQPTTVLDGPHGRAFTRLNHSSVGRLAAAVPLLGQLIRSCTTFGAAETECFTASGGREMRMIAVPVLGPFGSVNAVALWTGARGDPIPEIPEIGSVEWTAAGIAATTPPAQYLLRLSYLDTPAVHTVPEMLASFHNFEDRPGFFSLFNLDNPTDRWAGTATKIYEDGNAHQLHIAAHASGAGTDRTVRAIVCDITDDQTRAIPDISSLALRAMPIPPGHALGLVDLKTGFIHEWLTDEHSPLAGWRHHNPEIEPGDQLMVATTCYELAANIRRTATTQVRVRFHPNDEWITLHGRWNRIADGDRPQALIDVTPISPSRIAPISHCNLCQAMALGSTDR